jgi:ABC-type nitrate/sulfonate/bicarbonate transport system substrate-binding protein
MDEDFDIAASSQRAISRATFLSRSAALSVALAAGAVAPELAAAAARVRRASSLTKITVIAEWLPWAAHAPVFAAIDQGFFAKHGLDVNYIGPPNAGDQMKFVAGGRAAIALTQTPDVIRARAEGIPVKMIGQLWSGEPGGILSLPGSGITNPKDLEGKTLGIGETPDHQGGFQTIMKTAHADPSKVKLVNKGYGGTQLLLAHKVNAISSVIGGEYSAVKQTLGKTPTFIYYRDWGVPNYPLLVWFATEKYIAENPAIINGFLAGVKEGAASVSGSRSVSDTAMKTIEAEDKTYTPAQHMAMLGDVHPYFTTHTAISPKIVAATEKWMENVIINGKPWLEPSQAQPASSYLA